MQQHLSLLPPQMGGELEAGLFIGPVDTKTIVEWILLFKINSKENIVSQMKHEYPESDDDEYYYMNDLYKSSSQLEEDYEKLQDKLNKLKLHLVMIHNCESDEFKVGRLVKTDDTIIHIDDVNNNKKLWKEFGVDKLHLFGGIIGDFEVSF